VTYDGAREHRRPRVAFQQASVDELRARLIERLRSRRAEIEEAIFPHIRPLGGPAASEDAEYEVGLAAAVSAGVDYCLTGLEQGPGWVAPVPLAVVEQVRRAAHSGTSPETSMLRLIVGHRLLGTFVMDEAERVGLSRDTVAMLELRTAQETLLEHITPTIMREHKRESERMARSAEQRRLQLVQRLLAGEHVDASELRYDFDKAWHLGVIAIGAGGKKVLAGLAARIGLELLAVAHGENTQWAWLGARRKDPLARIELLLAADGVSFAIGEPAGGVQGWRLTHEQAQAALLVALRRPTGVTRCADVSLEAALLRHDWLRRSLLASYLNPLDGLRIGARTARETLRAYFDCQRNASSAAFRLGVTRHTVEKRLRNIEAALGRPLGTCLTELDVALRVQTVSGEASDGRRESRTGSTAAP
jgi:hypothetical protein